MDDLCLEQAILDAAKIAEWLKSQGFPYAGDAMERAVREMRTADRLWGEKR